MSHKPNWDMLLEGICPICQDNPLELRGREYVCISHKYPIRIQEEKFNKIVRNLEEQEGPNFSSLF